MENVVWSALDLQNVSTSFLANLVGRVAHNHPAYRALVNELTHRYETERQ